MSRKRHCTEMVKLALRIVRHEGGRVCYAHKYPTVHAPRATFTVESPREVTWEDAGGLAGGGAFGKDWIDRLWPPADKAI